MTSKWLSQAGSLLVFLVLARLLSPEAFGLVAMASVVTAFLNVFVDQGLGEAVVQRKELDREHLDAAFWLQLGGALAMFVGLVALAPLAAWFFDQPQLTAVVRWLAFSLVIQAFCGTQAAILRRELRFKELAWRNILGVVAGGAVGITMAFSGFGVWSLVGQRLSNGIVGAIALWASTDWRPRPRFSFQHIRDLFGYGVHVVGMNFLNFFNRRSDDLLIGYFLGPVALGYYTVAYRILLVMTNLLISVISQVALPAFSRLQDDTVRLRNAFLRTTRLVSACAFPVFLGVAALAPDLLHVIAAKWLPAAPVMRVLAFIGIIHALAYFNGTVFRAVGRPGIALVLTLINAVCNFTLFLIVVRWGILAVALAYTIRGYVIFPLPLILLRRILQLRLQEYVRNLLPTIASGLVMLAVVWLSNSWWMASWPLYGRLVGGTALGALVYLAMLRVTGPQTLSEIVSTGLVLLQRDQRTRLNPKSQDERI